MASIQASLGSRFLMPISFSYYDISERGRFMRDRFHRYARLLMFQYYESRS